MEYNIFISYSRKDFDKVKAIKEEIEQYTNFECWMDLSAIESGDPSFVDAIAKGIGNCKIFLFMLSNHSQNSRYAIGEMELARKLGKKAILINIDDCSLTPSFFLLYSHSNMRNWNMFEEKKQLLSDLKMWLGVKENAINILNVEEKHQPQNIHKHESSNFLSKALVRYQLQNLMKARREKPCIALCSEPQKGASQLISSFLQNGDNESYFHMKAGMLYYQGCSLVPLDGLDSGIAWRFSAVRGDNVSPYPIKARLLTIGQLIEWICCSYYQNVSDVMNYSEEEIRYINKIIINYKNYPIQTNAPVTEEDIVGMKDQILRHWHNEYLSLIARDFLDQTAEVARHIPQEDLADVFSFLWNFDSLLTKFFKRMVRTFNRLNFSQEVYLPVNAINTTINGKCGILSYKCLSNISDSENDTNTDVFLPIENHIDKIENISKAELCALMSEVIFPIDEKYLLNDVFVKADLLKLSPLRVSNYVKKSQIDENLSDILVRGKCRMLFDNYMDSLSMNVLLFCHDQYPPTSLWSSKLQDWVNAYIGQTSSMRESFLKHTHNISPLFIVSTKFNQDLVVNNCEPSRISTELELRLKERFENVLFDKILQGNKMEWVTSWTPLDNYFNNVYLLSNQKEHLIELPNYEQLRSSFINSPVSCRFFKNPTYAWDMIATKNNGGIQYILENLCLIIPTIERLREEQLLNTIFRLTETINNSKNYEQA